MLMEIFNSKKVLFNFVPELINKSDVIALFSDIIYPDKPIVDARLLDKLDEQRLLIPNKATNTNTKNTFYTHLMLVKLYKFVLIIKELRERKEYVNYIEINEEINSYNDENWEAQIRVDIQLMIYDKYFSGITVKASDYNMGKKMEELTRFYILGDPNSILLTISGREFLINEMENNCVSYDEIDVLLKAWKKLGLEGEFLYKLIEYRNGLES